MSSTEEHPERHGTVVGVDGSPGSTRAFEWAAARGALFSPLRPTIAWSYPWWALLPPPFGSPAKPPADLLDDLAMESARAAMDEAGIDVAADVVVRRGGAAAALIEEAADANAAVVGSRGRSPLAERMLGSVSSAVVSRAACTTVVVPAEAVVERGPEQIVVGVDGSENADRALSWALRYGDVDGDRIDVLVAWTTPTFDGQGGIVSDPEQAEALAAATAERAIERANAADDARISVRTSPLDPRAALLAAEVDAQLVVVGARGHTGWEGLLLGSVASALSHAPKSPLAVVR